MTSNRQRRQIRRSSQRKRGGGGRFVHAFQKKKDDARDLRQREYVKGVLAAEEAAVRAAYADERRRRTPSRTWYSPWRRRSPQNMLPNERNLSRGFQTQKEPSSLRRLTRSVRNSLRKLTGSKRLHELRMKYDPAYRKEGFEHEDTDLAPILGGKKKKTRRKKHW